MATTAPRMCGWARHHAPRIGGVVTALSVIVLGVHLGNVAAAPAEPLRLREAPSLLEAFKFDISPLGPYSIVAFEATGAQMTVELELASSTADNVAKLIVCGRSVTRSPSRSDAMIGFRGGLHVDSLVSEDDLLAELGRGGGSTLREVPRDSDETGLQLLHYQGPAT